jgi:hypothetical protein
MTVIMYKNYFNKVQQTLKKTASYIMLLIYLSSCTHFERKVNNLKSDAFVTICKEFKGDVEFARNYKYIKKHPLEPSVKINSQLIKFVTLTTKEYSKKETDIILTNIKKEGCYDLLKDLSILAEEQMENKAADDFIKYYSKNKINNKRYKSAEQKILALENLMKINNGYSFIYLKNYFILTANELEMLNNLKRYKQNTIKIKDFYGKLPNLKNKYVTFVGAGFPLSGISINILTNAKINLIDIDKVQLEKAKQFLNIIAKAGIINIKDFSFIHANAKNLSYSKGEIKSDILHLASALPNLVKKKIFDDIAKDSNKIIIIDRYVSGIFKLLYSNKVTSQEIPQFKTIAKIYPENIYYYKVHKKGDIIYKPTSIINVNSSRLLILKSS